ncbi:MAG: cytochrome c biogenesis protein CcsA [bacterium]|nr:cytochrome c biogenesis protein CcsA [bacterium]MXV90111.1 cytochrome C biogenesis protein [Acidimicrobiia bacterium]MYI19921.1 cytochrome C biogenesis protein [Acidimicrobiia bacterium]
MSILLGRPPGDRPPSAAPGHTGSRATRILGVATLVGLVGLCLCAFIFSPPDSRPGPEPGSRIGQFDAVRLMYVHFPAAIWTYSALGLCALASGVYLWRRGVWWDRLAHASAEIGVLLCAVTLLTGMIWGRPIWNTWWEWGDVRVVTTLVLFLTYAGYLALRSVPAAPEARARRSAILGVGGAVLIPIVNRSVEWWENRTLHQQSTLEELRIEDLTLFTLVLGIAVMGVFFLWILIHRFRLAWLEAEVESAGLEAALAERRAEAGEVAATGAGAGGTGEGGSAP